MDKPSTGVVRFVPQQKRQAELEPIDRAGHAVIALLQKAADIAEENIERAMTVAHRLGLELRTAEDRIRELEGEVERLESRATRAEQWLGTIKKEIEDTKNGGSLMPEGLEKSMSRQEIADVIAYLRAGL